MSRRNVLVLGINDGHDAGAAIIRDGRVIAAVQEERLNNIKHYAGMPEKSICQILRSSKTHPTEISLIALASYDPPGRENLRSIRTRAMVKLAPILHSDGFIRLYASHKKRQRNLKGLRNTLDRLGLLPSLEVVIVEHQLAHASAAYRSSPWINTTSKVLVLTADGSGDGLSSTVSVGYKGQIDRIEYSSYYDSIGNAFYTEITRYLGLKPWDHENKVMGLAGYGKADYCIDKMQRIISVDPKNPLRFKNKIGAVGSGIQPKLKQLLSGQRFDNIAAAAQEHLENLVVKWVENAIKTTGLEKIACAGGIFLNVKLNKLLRENKHVSEIFFYPAPDDEGLPIGAALQGYQDYCNREGIKAEQVPIAETYYGPLYDDEDITNILALDYNKGPYNYDYHKDIDGLIGELLSKGKIIGRCSGGLEWGPRALGNRSILADPQDVNTVHRINFAIKQRDFWMPFAPSILEERENDYLIEGQFAPYMIMAFDSTNTKEGGLRIPATLHPYDKTCRPQTVREGWNASYHRIIKEFETITGVGAVLNTSFNLHGYPMVGTPELALWTFDNSRLDALVLGNFLVMK